MLARARAAARARRSSASARSPRRHRPRSGTGAPGWPKCPSGTSVTSRCRRSEYQRSTTCHHARARQLSPARGCQPPLRGCIPAPRLDALPEQLGELLDLVRGEQRRDLLADASFAAVRAEELPRDLVEVRQVLARRTPRSAPSRSARRRSSAYARRACSRYGRSRRRRSRRTAPSRGSCASGAWWPRRRSTSAGSPSPATGSGSAAT